MRFDVRGFRSSQGVVRLVVEADDAAGAALRAREQGLAVMSAQPRRGFGGFGGLGGLRLGRRAARFPLLQFTHELMALLQAGLSLPETLDTLLEKETRADVRPVLATMRARMFEGQSFSRVLESLPQAFPVLYVTTVRASERSGDLVESLARYVDYHERLDLVRKKVVSASIYPAALLVLGGLVILFLLGYVVPRFSAIYAESGRDLPWMSRLLLQWGQGVQQHGAAIGAVGVAATVLAIATARRLLPRVVTLLTRIPSIGSRLATYHLARFYRSLGMLLRGGTAIVPALAMVGGLLPQAMQAGLARATQQIREGIGLSDAMAAAGLTTPVAARMLRVGENSGDMAAMMERIAGFHDEELARWIEWFTKLFEPVLMAFIGVVIGGIVILMYLPIFELAGSLQ
ncbi:type II secretion system F family protein [Pseudorhodoferax sp. Leaf267]|uniref:type II secretion system F family protein n=1 Tax=Pseudorhodoferax sp. Leaf267 TaxID=1736316 RepID=UPI0006F6468E|nr:type II secretion system F family protein [Pseudorhodoferax sp. Leaf267]KQP12648.1 type II secretion system protein [Pseudorhodoferax sp. Leaf267]